MKNFIILLCLLHAAFAAPQFITFKDGQIGVNFAGYHAETGLLGGGNGRGLFGGLGASAGTPYGQNAAAGVRGQVNGRTAGILYAGAQATPDVGASTVLGGEIGQGGFSGAEAHVPGKITSRTRTTLVKEHQPDDEYITETVTVTSIQKIKPPKKFHQHTENDVVKTNKKHTLIAPTEGPYNNEDDPIDSYAPVHRSRTVVDALQIPVGILQSLQQSLGR